MADDSGGGASPLVVGIVAVLSAAIAGAASFGAGYLAFASKDQELKVHLVEIAIGILRADPKEDVTPARGWAIDVIEKNSGILFSLDDRAALLHKPIVSLQASLDNLRPTPPSEWARRAVKSAVEEEESLQRGEVPQPTHSVRSEPVK